MGEKKKHMKGKNNLMRRKDPMWRMDLKMILPMSGRARCLLRLHLIIGDEGNYTTPIPLTEILGNVQWDRGLPCRVLTGRELAPHVASTRLRENDATESL